MKFEKKRKEKKKTHHFILSNKIVCSNRKFGRLQQRPLRQTVQIFRKKRDWLIKAV